MVRKSGYSCSFDKGTAGVTNFSTGCKLVEVFCSVVDFCRLRNMQHFLGFREVNPPGPNIDRPSNPIISVHGVRS